MGYRAHAVKRKEEYANKGYFNWNKISLEALFCAVADDFNGNYDEGDRTEISVESLEKVIAEATDSDIEKAGLLDDTDLTADGIRDALKDILEDADKANGYVEIVWF